MIKNIIIEGNEIQNKIHIEECKVFHISFGQSVNHEQAWQILHHMMKVNQLLPSECVIVVNNNVFRRISDESISCC